MAEPGGTTRVDATTGSGNGTAAAGYVIGVDIGGTFTDCAAIGPDGTVQTGKVPTRPNDRARSFFEAIDEAARGFDLGLDEMLQRCERLVHGTTAGTNALITRGGAKVGLLATVGHGDAIYFQKAIGRISGLAPEAVLDLPNTDKPDPFVPRRLVGEVIERVDYEGDVVIPLNEDSVREQVRQLRGEGVDALAVSLLWSIRNAEHERRVEEIVREDDGDIFVSRASNLSPRVGEFERTMTTIMNAYLGPLMTRYVDAIERGAHERGYTGRVLYAQCAGGAMTADEVQEAPIRTVHSGPVSGTIASAFLAARMGEPNLIVTDMGGTSFDVSVVRDNSPDVREVAQIERFEIAMPMVYLDTIGAGGGSIAWIDDAGRLQVGPRSAGAEPGPACYGLGGTDPTVTDADVLLGIIDPDNFLHGKMKLDRDAAEAAIRRVAEPLGLGLPEAAAGINRIIDGRMADLLRRMSVLRGLDPRDFVCFSYGGGGPVHAGAVAREVGFKRIVIPLLHAAPVWSAFGAAIADVSHVYQNWQIYDMPADPARVTEILGELERRARETLLAEGFDHGRQELRRALHMKYRAQLYDVEVAVPAGGLGEPEIARAGEDFARIYDELHGAGAGYREGGFQITGFTVRARGLSDQPELSGHLQVAKHSWTSREVYWHELGGFAQTPVLRMERGLLDEELEGPMLLELPDTVVVLRPGHRARLDEVGSLVIDLESAR